MKNKDFITGTKRSGRRSPKDKALVTIILLGQNHGYRMKAYGPISLIDVAGKTLIERQVTAIKATFTNFEIIVCAGFESFKIVNYVKQRFSNINIRVVENQIYFNSNCCESARLCLNNTSNKRIIICGGGVLLMSYHLDEINLKKSTIVTQRQVDDANFEIGVIKNKGLLENLSVGVKEEYWTELLYLNGSEVIDRLQTIISNPDYKNKFMFESINELIKTTELAVTTNSRKSIIKIDNIKTLRKMVQ